MDASNVELAFQKILTEIYRLVSQKAMEQQEESGNKPGQGQTIRVDATATENVAGKKGCC